MQIQCALREKISEWTKIGANETVKQWINCGARIPLTNNPSEFFSSLTEDSNVGRQNTLTRS